MRYLHSPVWNYINYPSIQYYSARICTSNEGLTFAPESESGNYQGNIIATSDSEAVYGP